MANADFQERLARIGERPVEDPRPTKPKQTTTQSRGTGFGKLFFFALWVILAGTAVKFANVNYEQAKADGQMALVLVPAAFGLLSYLALFLIFAAKLLRRR